MDALLRALAVYLFLLVVFRVSGKRTLAQVTTFDFVLLLIIAEATQQGLIGDDFSVTKALLLVTALLGADIALSLLQVRFSRLDRLLDSAPLVIVEDGRPLYDRMKKARVDESDVLAAARERQGLERIEQIKYGVLERSGGISVVPYRDG